MKTGFTGTVIFGFWHEDSFIMNLVLKNLRGRQRRVECDATAEYKRKLY